jgi:hypothetical protein
MKKAFVCILMVFVTFSVISQGAKMSDKDIKALVSDSETYVPEGYYIGDLKVDESVQLPLVLQFKDSKLYFSSPSQTANSFEISYQMEDNSNITIESSLLGLSIKATIDKNEIKGVFYQSGLQINIIFEKQDSYKTPEKNRWQTPTSFNYTNKEVIITNKKNNRKYFGTLTILNSNIKRTAILFVTGSGIQNRDEEIFKHKPFLVISDYLTKAGYYTLRCDDYGYNGEDISNQTTLNTIDDIDSQIAYLKNNKNIDKIVGVVNSFV